jgi:hypothetical protein
MIENLIKSILEQVGILVERRAPEELMKTLPNGQWGLLRKAAPKVLENPHSEANMMTTRLFNHANAVHEALQPHFDKHIADFRSAPMRSDKYVQNLNTEAAMAGVKGRSGRTTDPEARRQRALAGQKGGRSNGGGTYSGGSGGFEPEPEPIDPEPEPDPIDPDPVPTAEVLWSIKLGKIYVGIWKEVELG